MESVEEFRYEPGVCNIDNKGVQIRRVIASVTAIVGVMMLVILYFLQVPPIIRYITASGFAFGVLIISMEAKLKFCVFNGINGSYEQDYNAIQITDPIARSTDRKRATKVLIQVILMALLIGLFALISF